jgi:hypothetical protein
LSDDNATVRIAQDGGSGILKQTNGAAISVLGGAGDFAYFGGITNGLPQTGATSSYLLSVAGTTGGSVTIQAPGGGGTPFIDTANGISIRNANGDVNVFGGARLSGTTPQGILIDGELGGTFEFDDIVITGATNEGVLINGTGGVGFAGTARFNSLAINLPADARGFVASNSANAGSINIGDLSSITTASTTAPAIVLDNILDVQATFTTVTSGVPNAAGTAIDIAAGTGGLLDITSAFTVGGAAGTVANNVNNAGTITVLVPPP